METDKTLSYNIIIKHQGQNMENQNIDKKIDINEVGLYTVYDKLAKKCGPIFEAENSLVAMRSYLQMAKGLPYPDDYELYYVGRYSKSTMIAYTSDLPVKIEKPSEEKKAAN